MSEINPDQCILGSLWCIDCYSMEGKKEYAHFMYEGMSLCENHMIEEIKREKSG
jgi:hypothetical protein